MDSNKLQRRLDENEKRLKSLLLEFTRGVPNPPSEDALNSQTIAPKLTSDMVADLSNDDAQTRLQCAAKLRKNYSEQDLEVLLIDIRKASIIKLMIRFFAEDSNEIDDEFLGSISNDWLMFSSVTRNTDTTADAMRKLYLEPLKTLMDRNLRSMAEEDATVYLVGCILKLFRLSWALNRVIGEKNSIAVLNLNELIGTSTLARIQSSLENCSKRAILFCNQSKDNSKYSLASTGRNTRSSLIQPELAQFTDIFCAVCFSNFKNSEHAIVESIRHLKTVLDGIAKKLEEFPRSITWSEWQSLVNGYSYVTRHLKDRMNQSERNKLLDETLKDSQVTLINHVKFAFNWWISNAKLAYHDASSDNYESYRTHFQDEKLSFSVSAFCMGIQRIQKILKNFQWLSKDSRQQICIQVTEEFLRIFLQKFSAIEVSPERKSQFRSDIEKVLSTVHGFGHESETPSSIQTSKDFSDSTRNLKVYAEKLNEIFVKEQCSKELQESMDECV